MTNYTRGDYSGKRGVAVTTDSLTFIGTGGVDVKGGGDIKSGATSLMNSTGLLTENVDGQIMALGPWTLQVADTITGTVMSMNGATNPEMVVPKAGSVVGATIFANTVLATDMHVSCTVFVGATATTFTATLGVSGSDATYTNQDKDTDAFAAGKAITIKAYSDTMVTTTLSAMLFVEV
jgi:hypothetical protein